MDTTRRNIAFGNASIFEEPFPHFLVPDCIDENLGEALLNWFETEAKWEPSHEEGFFDCYILNLDSKPFPKNLDLFVSPEFIADIRSEMESVFRTTLTDVVNIHGQKMVAGQVIKIHTDLTTLKQTHRFLIHVNRGWSIDKGGIFMALGSALPEDLSPKDCYYLPEHLTAVGFEISPRSYHAVSEVKSGHRFTLGYSFHSVDGYHAFADEMSEKMKEIFL